MKSKSHYLQKPVLSMQTMLRNVSLQNPEVLPLIPDSTFGRGTCASVRSFQQHCGLEETGSVNLDTWQALVRAHGQAGQFRRPPMLCWIWPPEQVLRPGDCNDHLCLLQAMLSVLARRFPALPAPSVTGQLDGETREALLQIQQRSRLPVTGCLDLPTWHAVCGLYRTAVGDGFRACKEPPGGGSKDS